ncbi:MAG: hypothetical protein KKC24_23885 [Gammaproteobacteria bacterium]|nr:hypothetical protein [Gammaproteobacteria bacterium]MBU0821890.1 hypothetical protein [Gammaproteobacteria bacterium]MBU0844003.1 hypothetical protein [Gammaproteobacteria bacterium]MBU1842254.1 hypothetical protein [Gammaproteobacteria bacterium]
MLDIPAESGEVFDASFDWGIATNPSNSLMRTEQLNQAQEGLRITGDTESILVPPRNEPDTPMLDAQVARDQVAGMGLEIKIPDQGIRQGVLDILVDRHREQAARQQVMARSKGGSMGTQFAAGLAASMLDPLNIASAFVPVVGEARYAAMLARATGPLGRAGVRFGVGAAGGALGAAIIEPLPLLAASMDQTEYGLIDSLANIALGGLLGGGLHTVGGAVSDALRRRMATDTPSGDLAPSLTDRQGQQSLRAADFDRLFDQDPATALRASLARQLDEDSATLYRNAERQAIDEIRPTLIGERVGNVADLHAERISLTQQAMKLDDTFKDLAKQFQGQRMSRKQAERAARDTIAAQREQIGARQAEINTVLERNRAGEFDRRDLGLIERGEVPERLRPQIEARAKQIMQGYQQRPLGAAVRTARETAEAADWTVRDSALRSAVAQSVSGRDVDVRALFDLETPAKSAAAMDSLRRPAPQRLDPQGQSESLRVESEAKAQGQDELADVQKAFDDDEALVREMLEQLPEQDRAAVLAAGREEADAAIAQAERAERYSDAYRAAAICDIRNGQ